MPCSKCKGVGHNARTCVANGGSVVVVSPCPDECPVCLTGYKGDGDKLTNVSCNHTFCVECVEHMYETRIDTCPLCRVKHNHTYKERQFPERPVVVETTSLELQTLFNEIFPILNGFENILFGEEDIISSGGEFQSFSVSGMFERFQLVRGLPRNIISQLNDMMEKLDEFELNGQILTAIYRIENIVDTVISMRMLAKKEADARKEMFIQIPQMPETH